MAYRSASDLSSYSRRAGQRIAGYVTAGTMRKTGETTTRRPVMSV